MGYKQEAAAAAETCAQKTNKRDDDGQAATVYHTKSIRRLHDNLFVVYATARVNAIAVISRNMVVVRHHKQELTLINPIRLDERSESRLLKLGRIERLLRLAPRHGVSHDRYYLTRFPRARRWAPTAGAATAKPKPTVRIHDDSTVKPSKQLPLLQQQQQVPVHRILTHDDDAILPGCHVFVFQQTTEPECCILLLQDYAGNVLVTADALQAHRDNPYVNMAVRAKQAASGLYQSKIVIPPIWLRIMSSSSSSSSSSVQQQSQQPLISLEPPTGSSSSPISSPGRETSTINRKVFLQSEFERLLRLDFECLIASSGVMIRGGAKEQAVMAVDQAFAMLW